MVWTYGAWALGLIRSFRLNLNFWTDFFVRSRERDVFTFIFISRAPAMESFALVGWGFGVFLASHRYAALYVVSLVHPMENSECVFQVGHIAGDIESEALMRKIFFFSLSAAGAAVRRRRVCFVHIEAVLFLHFRLLQLPSFVHLCTFWFKNEFVVDFILANVCSICSSEEERIK